MRLQNYQEVVGERIVIHKLELTVEVRDPLKDSLLPVQLDAPVDRELCHARVDPFCLRLAEVFDGVLHDQGRHRIETQVLEVLAPTSS